MDWMTFDPNWLILWDVGHVAFRTYCLYEMFVFIRFLYYCCKVAECQVRCGVCCKHARATGDQGSWQGLRESFASRTQTLCNTTCQMYIIAHTNHTCNILGGNKKLQMCWLLPFCSSTTYCVSWLLIFCVALCSPTTRGLFVSLI